MQWELSCSLCCRGWQSRASRDRFNTCPSREATEAAVHALLGQSSIPPADLQQIEIVDLGERYVITVKERTREYTDETRDCGKRARVAAVFVALTLAPPDIGSPDATPDAVEPSVPVNPIAPPTPVSPSPPVQSPAHVVPSPPNNVPNPTRWVPQAELGASFALAPRSEQSVVNWGGQFRFVLTSNRWGGTLGVDIPARSTLEIQSIRIQQARYTADLSLRINGNFGQFRSALDLGPLLALVQLQQMDLPGANRVSRWQAGLRLAASTALAGRIISPFVGVNVQIIPFPTLIAVIPDGVIGHTSAVWLGLTMGILLR